MIWFLLAVLALGLIALVIVSRAATNTRPKRSAAVDKEFVSQRWQAIEELSKTGGGGLRQAVSEADKLLDYVMKNQGYPGETMADRLKKAQSNLSNRNAVWQAHKLRNAFAHEAEFDLVPSQANEAIKTFERALKDLGAL